MLHTMTSPIIKQLGSQPGMTVEQRRRERDLIDQVNKRAGTLEQRIAALEADPVMFAFGIVTTDGSGDLTTDFAFGCTLSVANARVRMTFTKPRRAALSYVAGGAMLNDVGGKWANVPRADEKLCDIRFNTATASIFGANTNQFTAFVWAMGLRA